MDLVFKHCIHRTLPGMEFSLVKALLLLLLLVLVVVVVGGGTGCFGSLVPFIP